MKRAPAREAGQATVELAIALPVVAAALLLVVQVLLVARGQLQVDHAAREAARGAAVDPDPAGAGRTVAARRLDPARTSVRVTTDGTTVTVEVSHRIATDVPLVGRFVPDVPAAGAATFRVESHAHDYEAGPPDQ